VARFQPANNFCGARRFTRGHDIIGSFPRNDHSHFSKTVLPVLLNLSRRQTNFYLKALSGPEAALVLLEGVSGTGKTYALVCLAIGLMLLDRTVALCTPDALSAAQFLRTFNDIVSRHWILQPLLQRCVFADASSTLTVGSTVRFDSSSEAQYIHSFTAAKRFEEFLASNQDDAMVVEYWDHVRSQRRGLASPSSLSAYADVSEALQRRTHDNPDSLSDQMPPSSC